MNTYAAWVLLPNARVGPRRVIQASDAMPVKQAEVAEGERFVCEVCANVEITHVYAVGKSGERPAHESAKRVAWVRVSVRVPLQMKTMKVA